MQAELINQLANRGIVAEAVCKSYGDHLVLDKVSLAVARGTIFSLLGPNGTGKPKPGLWHFFGTRPGGRYEGGWRRIARRGGFRRPGRACEAVDHVRCYVDACPDASPRPLAELRAGAAGRPQRGGVSPRQADSRVVFLYVAGCEAGDVGFDLGEMSCDEAVRRVLVDL
jgi:hypothetical protein